MMIEITESDIDEIEKVIGLTFDNERRQAIGCMKTCDVQACPGSGKTTALVAKLGILSKKIKGSHGICVLSHTNIAHEVIQHKLSDYAGLLWSYPHFVGTIQSFIDTYLAIPAMIEIFGTRPWAIDNNIFKEIVDNRKGYLNTLTQNWLSKNPRKKLPDIRYSYDDLSLCWLEDGQERRYLKDPKKPVYKNLMSFKNRITKHGCIAYHDAFSLAREYLDKHPDLAQIISTRFKFVFLDEAQDTSKHQWELLRSVFTGDVVFQCFGDKNQAIFNLDSASSTLGWQISNSPLTLNHTHRFNTEIAALNQNMVEATCPIRSYTNHQKCSHTLFLFDSPSGVIEAFARHIQNQQLDGGDGPLKVVGWRKEHDTELSLQSYHHSFKKPVVKPDEQESLRAYFALAREAAQSGNAGGAHQWLQKGLVKLARLQNLKSGNHVHTPTTLMKAWVKVGLEEEYRATTLDWINAFVEGRSIEEAQVFSSLEHLFEPLIEEDDWKWTPPSETFLTSTSTPRPTALSPHNIFTFDKLQIEIDTIHGVKGETHMATMVVETFYRKNHLKSILALLTGDRPKSIDTSLLPGLRLAYVAMTRPTHLLCLAMQKNDVDYSDCCKLAELGWEIEEI